MTLRTVVLLSVVGLMGMAIVARAQDRSDRRERILERFDRDGDGRLNADERDALRQWVKKFSGGQSAQQPAKPQTLFAGEADLYKLAKGPHAVAVIETHMLHDDARDKQIPLRISYPESGGPFPVVILCHGAMGSKDGLLPLTEHWVSHGYVVIQPTFGDSVSLMRDEEKRQYRSVHELLNSPRVLQEWDDRPRDVQYLIDELIKLSDALPQLADKLDNERIIVGGHSFGAHTTMLLAGLSLKSRRIIETPDFRDPRIDATFMISPQGTGQSITPESYTTMQGPMLMITGDNDGSALQSQKDADGHWRKQAYEHVPEGDKYLLWIDDAHHNFGGINGRSYSGSGPDVPDHVVIVKTTILAFLDAYAQADPQATAYLTSDQLKRESGDMAYLEHK